MALLKRSSLVFLLAYGSLIGLIFCAICWYLMVICVEKHVNLNSKNTVSQLHSEIDHFTELLQAMKSSSTNLARSLSSNLDTTTSISFSDLKNKVAPLLFQAFETVPYLAQISYIGKEGFFFSYHTDHDQVLAMYSNSSSSWGASSITYVQPVNRETGQVYREATNIISNPFMNARWINEAFNVSNESASLGTWWHNDSDFLFLSSVRITGRGVISLGFHAKAITDLVTRTDQNGFVSLDLNYKKKGHILFVVTMVTIFIALFSFLFINYRAMRREMHLCASLIKQCEATHQSEKKNMNKSMAFASASHDIRASLAGITGLIDLSYELLDPGSELETNLKQMKDCTQDLLGLLNCILDTSKIEAGKMQLEEVEFDVFHLLEDVVDFYHPLAMKKGVDLILDPCNGSVSRYSRVKGDRGKLKQVLSNLLSNAVKFTEEGHIAVRAWTRKPTLLLQNSTVSNEYAFEKYLSCLFRDKNQARDDLESLHSIQENPRSMDFIFEVDDTGKGIPKENYKSVFENYVQVKETALGQGGTGLGLGIVQSLVRLMHGDIEIVEKDMGERGTRFRFNVILTLCESEEMTREGIECGSGSRMQPQGHGQTMHSSSRICSMSPSLHISSSSLKPETSLVVLFIANEERQRTSRKFMERFGIRVKVVSSVKDLVYTLKKIKLKGEHSSDQISLDLTYHNSPVMATRVPMDGTEHMPLDLKKTNAGASPGFILLVIDANVGEFCDLYTIVSNFKKDLLNPCKVIWLDKPFKALDQDDIVISKPFHGSRLFETVKLLPEFGGAWQSKPKRECSKKTVAFKSGKDSKDKSPIQDENTFQRAKLTLVHQGEIKECGSSSKPLSGKKFLVVDDSELLRKLASATLISLGATMEQCENGEEAVHLVDEGLSRDFPNPPYHYILMDCQMPVMDGVEATKWIRKIEKPYGVRIPIIALTACTENMKIENGIDFRIMKPIKKEHILEAIAYIHATQLANGSYTGK